MKKLLSVIGVICIAACVLAFLYATYIGYMRNSIFDAPAELYNRLRQTKETYLTVSKVFAGIGAVSLIIRAII